MPDVINVKPKNSSGYQAILYDGNLATIVRITELFKDTWVEVEYNFSTKTLVIMDDTVVPVNNWLVVVPMTADNPIDVSILTEEEFEASWERV